MSKPFDLNDLLPCLFEGIFEQPLWSTFLERLRRLTQSSYVGLIMRPKNRPALATIELFAGTRSPTHLQKHYFDKLYAIDPVPYDKMQDCSPYPILKLLNIDDPDHRAYYEDFLVECGMGNMQMMRLTENSGVRAWLILARAEPAYPNEVSKLLTNLAPYLTHALRIVVEREHERFKAELSSGALRRLNLGWLALSKNGLIIEADEYAASLLNQSKELWRDIHNRLCVRDPIIDRELKLAIGSFVNGDETRPRALRLSQDPWLEVLLVPFDGKALSAVLPAVLIVYIRGDTRSAADHEMKIAQLFKLAPSEARLALALSRGLSISEAASEATITVETARGYSKKIYSKIGARGQPDLIRFILNSVLAIS